MPAQQPLGRHERQPADGRNADAIDIDASDTSYRLIRFWDTFNIPILKLKDRPGELTGERQESGGIICCGAKPLDVYDILPQ
jgi:acetyl-CoA carboxylase carboxyltransferase component